MQWLRLWIDSLHDFKLIRLSLAQRGAWWGIVTIAGECKRDGRLESGGHPLTIDDIAEMLHVKTKEDREALESMVREMVKSNSLAWNNGHVLTVVNFVKRNVFSSPSADKEAVAERVQKHRERKRELRQLMGADDKLAVFAQIYEVDIGIITPTIGEELKDLSSQFPKEWFQEAVKEACANNARKLSYIKAILNRWQVDGFKSKPKGIGKKGFSRDDAKRQKYFSDVPVIQSGKDND